MVQHRCLPQRRLDRLLDGRQRLGVLLEPRRKRPLRERRAADIRHDLTGALIGQQLLLDQIDRQRPQAWPILRPTRRFGGERPIAHALAGGTAHPQRVVFCDLQPHRRQVGHLAALHHPQHLSVRVQRRLTGRHTRRADVPRPCPALLPDAASRRDGPVPHPRACRSPAAAGCACAATAASTHLRTAVCCCCGCLGQAGFQLPHPLNQPRILLQQRGDLLTLLGKRGFSSAMRSWFVMPLCYPTSASPPEQLPISLCRVAVKRRWPRGVSGDVNWQRHYGRCGPAIARGCAAARDAT